MSNWSSFSFRKILKAFLAKDGWNSWIRQKVVHSSNEKEALRQHMNAETGPFLSILQLHHGRGVHVPRPAAVKPEEQDRHQKQIRKES